ncbi:MAG: glycine cleavage T C-terminal barrel domain-containing protein, partial [Armatimonadota bacterium]
KAQVTVGIAIEGRGIPREGYAIRRPGGESIGFVTSGTYSPTLGKGIGLARVASGAARIGDPVEVMIRDTPFPARVAKLPFVKNV